MKDTNTFTWEDPFLLDDQLAERRGRGAPAPCRRPMETLRAKPGMGCAIQCDTRECLQVVSGPKAAPRRLDTICESRIEFRYAV